LPVKESNTIPASVKLAEKSGNRGAPHLKVPTDHISHVDESKAEADNVIPAGLASIEGEVELTGEGDSVEVADRQLADRSTEPPHDQVELADSRRTVSGDEQQQAGERTIGSEQINKTAVIQEEKVTAVGTEQAQSDEKQGQNNSFKKEVSRHTASAIFERKFF
jgi:hypothetical protein